MQKNTTHPYPYGQEPKNRICTVFYFGIRVAKIYDNQILPTDVRVNHIIINNIANKIRLS